MKKLFILAMIVLGTSLAQAQDIPNIEFTLFNNGEYALGIGENREDNRCVTIKSSDNTNSAITQVGSTLTYTVNQAGQLRRNGRTVGAPNLAFVSFFTSGRVNRLYTRQSGGNYTGRNIR